jgi:hypothetical protein
MGVANFQEKNTIRKCPKHGFLDAKHFTSQFVHRHLDHFFSEQVSFLLSKSA